MTLLTWILLTKIYFRILNSQKSIYFYFCLSKTFVLGDKGFIWDYLGVLFKFWIQGDESVGKADRPEVS